MEWFFTLPVTFLALILLIYYLTRKSAAYAKLKPLFPSLFTLFFLSLGVSILRLGAISRLFPYTEETAYILQLGIFFFTLVFSVKFIGFLLFDFFFSHKQAIKYPRLIRDIVMILLYAIGILLIAQYAFDFKITVVLASSAVLTVVAGFALQDILGDLFSGIALNLEESLQIGDWVRVGEYEGRIEQSRWRSIKIRTVDNVLVLIPNQVASREAVRNFGQGTETFALRTTIGVSYKNHPDMVIQTLNGVMESINSIVETPPPRVLVTRFDDFAIIYELRFFLTDYSKRNMVMGEINRKAWYAFKRKGIEIPFPIRDVYIKEARDDRATDEEIARALKNNEVLGTIDENQLNELVANIDVMVYGVGEILIHEGETGRHFFLVLSGEVEIIKNNRVVNTLGPNDYFGELSLFTGEKTTADVRVSRECRVLQISPQMFRETVKLNKTMALKLSEVIAARKARLKEFSEADRGSRTLEIKKESESIFLRIRKIFSV